MRSDVPTDVSCEEYASECEADAKALLAAREVGMPTFSDAWRTLAGRVAALRREAAFARGVADRYRTLATTRGIRTRAEDSKMVLDNARQES